MQKTASFLAPFLAVYLLLVSVGLPLQRVYCECVGQVQLVLLGQQNLTGCHHDSPTEEEKNNALSPCCQKWMAEKTASQYTSCHDLPPSIANASEDGGCMDKEVIYPQFKTDFTFENITLELRSIVSAGLVAYNLGQYLPFICAPWESEAQFHSDFNHAPPLPLHGRSLRVRHQSFLC